MLLKVFPSPLKVCRFISLKFDYNTAELYMFPSPLEVDRFISDKILAILNQKGGFPSPLEVYRFISQCLYSHVLPKRKRFRPLARWIGLYHFKNCKNTLLTFWFPSPREVDRVISVRKIWWYIQRRSQLPSPPEVNRVISPRRYSSKRRWQGVSVPYRGR